MWTEGQFFQVCFFYRDPCKEICCRYDEKVFSIGRTVFNLAAEMLGSGRGRIWGAGVGWEPEYSVYFTVEKFGADLFSFSWRHERT